MTHKTAYLDCFSGISGDMLLGALLHCGLEKTFLVKELEKLQLPGMEISVTEHKECSINGCKVSIDQTKRQDLRTLPAIENLIKASGLSPRVINRSLNIFNDEEN